MTRHMFGWSLPPGCGRLPGEEPTPPCECCGKDPEGEGKSSCICTECPLCGMVGNPECYNTERFCGHAPLTYSPEQLQGQAELREQYRLQAEADAAEADYWEQHRDDDWDWYELGRKDQSNES